MSKQFVLVALLALLTYPHACVQGQRLDTLKTPRPRPSGEPITVKTDVGGTASDVTLVYVVNYGQEVSLPMIASDGSYSATIPAEDAAPGTLVRWYVRARIGGNTVRDPEYASSGDQQYYGTIVEDAGDSHSLPVLELYCKDSRAPYNAAKDATPSCSMWFRDRFYDNIVIRRRGESSMNWPKPKIKIDAGDQGNIFDIADGTDEVKEFNLGSEWYEPGENSFMRETLAWKVFKEMGVDSLTSYQAVVRLNGKYYGKYAVGEDWDSDPLKKAGYSFDPPGFLYKALDGEKSNLRWDLPIDQIQYYYNLATQKSRADEGAQKLVDFTRGISGGGFIPKSKFLFDSVNLPRTINHLAAQTVVANQDRCTKNFYVYYEPASGQWSMLPWDLESSFSIDRGLGGGPNLNDYCTLACEQWNSPLYCDKEHPQDLLVGTPWTLITTNINPASLAAGGRKLRVARSDPLTTAGRSLQQQRTNGSSNSNNNRTASSSTTSNPGLTAPDFAALPTDYDTDLTKQGNTVLGAPGTYNYLIDAILSVPRTRAMYVRRVRTLMDSFLPTGRLESLVTEEYNAVRDEAKRDVAQWGNPGDPDRGYRQLITEQLPIRKDQLYNEYGPDGNTPLIPEAQPSGAGSGLSIGRVEAGDNDGYVEVLNSNAYAVDVSGWKLSGGGIYFTFVPGTVIPAGDAVFVAAGSVGGFKGRGGSGPKGGQGLFVVGPLQGSITGGASDIGISQTS